MRRKCANREIYDVGFQIIKKALDLAEDAARKVEKPGVAEVITEVVSVQPIVQTETVQDVDSRVSDCINTNCESVGT